MNTTPPYTLEELLIPINYNVSSDSDMELINTFNKLISEIREYKKSSYERIKDYTAYVYEITHKINNKKYYGVRYTPNKKSSILIEDLKHYKSSTENEYFRNRQLSHPNEFEYNILKEFKHELEAINYEALIHQLYNVGKNKNFYNYHSAQFISVELYKKEINVYDYRGNKVLVKYEFFDMLSNEYNISKERLYSLLNGSNESICNKLYIDKSKYEHYHTIHTIWFFENNKLKSITDEYYKLLKYDNLGQSLISVIKGHQPSYRGYFIDRQKCIETYQRNNKIHTIYTHKDKIVEIVDTYINLINIVGSNISRLFNGEVHSTNGFYIDKDKCINDYKWYNTIYTLYWYDNDTLLELTDSYKNIIKITGSRIKDVLKYSKNDRCGKYFSNKQKCIDNYIKNNKKYTLWWYENNNLISKEFTYGELLNKLGGDVIHLVNNKRIKQIKGYFIDRELCIENMFRRS